jgi:uncharacterized protein with NRDE domain
MCTVSVLPRAPADGRAYVRVACNRDEQRSRAEARPPVCRRVGAYEALLPIDPASDGTWVAATSAGLGFALLNLNQQNACGTAGSKSRGRIIPALLEESALDRAVEQAMAMDLDAFAPFRLVIVSEWELAEVVWNGMAAELARHEELVDPAFFTSSGLGDWLVEIPRREVFEQFLLRQTPTPKQQDALHRHQWPVRPELSICMSREDARTVSYTTFEIGPDRVAINYQVGGVVCARQLRRAVAGKCVVRN